MIRHTSFVLALLAAPALAQNTVATDSEEGRKIIAAAEYAVGDCLVTATGSIVPNAKVDAADCEGEEATHRVAEVVIDPFDCPRGTGRLMQSGPDNATFCIEPLGE